MQRPISRVRAARRELLRTKGKASFCAGFDTRRVRYKHISRRSCFPNVSFSCEAPRTVGETVIGQTRRRSTFTGGRIGVDGLIPAVRMWLATQIGPFVHGRKVANRSRVGSWAGPEQVGSRLSQGRRELARQSRRL